MEKEGLAKVPIMFACMLCIKPLVKMGTGEAIQRTAARTVWYLFLSSPYHPLINYRM